MTTGTDRCQAGERTHDDEHQPSCDVTRSRRQIDPGTARDLPCFHSIALCTSAGHHTLAGTQFRAGVISESIGVCPILLCARVLVRVVASDKAAGRGAEHAMMAGIVTSRASHNGSLEAAFGRCRHRHARVIRDAVKLLQPG